MSISVVSAYYGLEDMTVDFLNNLVGKLPDDCELILVNAGSKKIEHPLITQRIDLDINKSFSNSMNAGIKQAKGDFVCVIGNDVFPTKNNWLKRLIKDAKQTDAFITSPINDKTTLKNYRLEHLYDKLHVAGFFPAVCWVMSRECIDKVGLFDEDYEGGTYEDNDYMRRVELAGGKLVVDTGVVLNHLESQTLKTLGDVHAISIRNADLFNSRWS